MDTSFVIEQVYDALIQKVWWALTDEDSMRKWYFPQMKQFAPAIGFEVVFTNDGTPFQKEYRVTKFVDRRLLAHRWIYKGYPGSQKLLLSYLQKIVKPGLKQLR